MKKIAPKSAKIVSKKPVSKPAAVAARSKSVTPSASSKSFVKAKKSRLKLWLGVIIGALLLGLSALVVMGIGYSQDNRSQAKENCKYGTHTNQKGKTVCNDKPKDDNKDKEKEKDKKDKEGKAAEDCKFGTHLNQKGNAVCNDKPEKNEIDGKTGCKGGKIEVRDPNGTIVCMEKCRSGEELGFERGSGKFGCVKIVRVTPIQNSIPTAVPTLNCPANQVNVFNANGKPKCGCYPGSHLKGNVCVPDQYGN